jgi:catechol 2,3-dioxygenase-like lactoylglutathione lyase family enzyme
MLGSKPASATVAVKDLNAADRFYGEVLGLDRVESGENDVRVFRSGDSTIVVYRSQFAGTNRATTVTWGVGKELDDIVRTLGSKGVAFEHYDLPGLTRQGDVHVHGDFKAAWFKDPDGNILHVNSH